MEIDIPIIVFTTNIIIDTTRAGRDIYYPPVS